MNYKTILILFATLILTACIDETERIKGHAIIVDNFIDRNPIENLYIEVKYTTDGGYTWNFLSSSKTDKYGYFEIDASYKTYFMNLDRGEHAIVYTDSEHSDTLGRFGFQFPDNTYSYVTIHLDTFSLSHKIWVIPRISSLGNLQPDEISIEFNNCELADTSQTNMTFRGSIDVNRTFTPIEIIMSMNTQHWLSYGTRYLATGSLKKNSQKIGFGYFKLEECKHTIEGDTLYLNFNVVDEVNP